MGVEPKIGVVLLPQIIHFNRVLNHYKPSILGFFPLFLETPIYSHKKDLYFKGTLYLEVISYRNALKVRFFSRSPRFLEGPQFGSFREPSTDQELLLGRFLATHCLVGLGGILDLLNSRRNLQQDRTDPQT